LKGLKTVQELTKEYGVHPTPISQWKQRLREGAPGLFGRGQVRDAGEREAEIAALYEKIGRLNRELEWVKKKWPVSVKEWRRLIEPGHAELSVIRQCELLELARSSYYDEPVPESEENLFYMRLIDEQSLRTPFYGSRRMAVWLQDQGHAIDAGDGTGGLGAGHQPTGTGASDRSVSSARPGDSPCVIYGPPRVCKGRGRSKGFRAKRTRSPSAPSRNRRKLI
jgi:hypothetical protein